VPGGVARLDDAGVEQIAAGVVHPVADAAGETLARHRDDGPVLDQRLDPRDEVGVNVAESGSLDHDAVLAVEIVPRGRVHAGRELHQFHVAVEVGFEVDAGAVFARVPPRERIAGPLDGGVGRVAVGARLGRGLVVDAAEWCAADRLEGVAPGGVVLPDAGAAVERAGVVRLARVHADERLGVVGLRGLDGTDRVHHVVGGGPIRRALAPGEHDRNRRVEHERERGRGVLHRVGAVHHDDAVGAGGDLLADGLGELPRSAAPCSRRGCWRRRARGSSRARPDRGRLSTSSASNWAVTAPVR